MFIAASFIIVLNWKRYKCPSTGERLSQQRNTTQQLKGTNECQTLREVKETGCRRPQAVWFHLRDILQKAMNRGQKWAWWTRRLEGREGTTRYRNTLRADCGTGHALHTPAKRIQLYAYQWRILQYANYNLINLILQYCQWEPKDKKKYYIRVKFGDRRKKVVVQKGRM